MNEMQKSTSPVKIRRNSFQNRDLEKLCGEVSQLKEQLEEERSEWQRREKDLQKAYVELQATHHDATLRVTADLQKETKKNKVLQDQLQRMSAFCQELRSRYETDIQAAKLQVQALQRGLHQQHQAHAEGDSQQQVLPSLRADTFTSELQKEKSKNRLLQEELKKLNQLHQELCERYRAEVLTLKQQAESHHQQILTLRAHDLTPKLQREKKKCKLLQEKLDQLNQEPCERSQAEVLTLKQEADYLLEIWSMKTDLSEQKSSLEKESSYRIELEELRTRCAHLVTQNTKLTTVVQAKWRGIQKKTAGPPVKPRPAFSLNSNTVLD